MSRSDSSKCWSQRLHSKRGSKEDAQAEGSVQNAVASVVKRRSMGASRDEEFVHCTPSRSCPKLEREEIGRFVSDRRFGQRLVGQNEHRAMLYDRVAAIAREAASTKTGDVASMLWTLQKGCDWLSMPANL